MPQWVQLCHVNEAPAEGGVIETGINGVGICLARIKGELAALDNYCPHRQGPLGQGWIEGEAVVCPWHSWAFNVHTGVAEPPEHSRVSVFNVQVVGETVMVELP